MADPKKHCGTCAFQHDDSRSDPHDYMNRPPFCTYEITVLPGWAVAVLELIRDERKITCGDYDHIDCPCWKEALDRPTEDD